MAKSLIEETDIKSILNKYLKGFTKDYDCLVALLSKANVQSADLIGYLQGLRNCISLLTRDFELLVNTILKVDWPSLDETVVREYQAFVTNLVSAHTYYLRACLLSLIKHFRPRTSVQDGVEKVTSADGGLRPEEVEFARVHTVLRNICGIVPTATKTLVTLLEENFPFQGRCASIHGCYVKNALTIPSYLPTTRHRVLHLVVSHMIDIDVRCRRDDIEECQDLAEEDQHIFGMEQTDENGEECGMRHTDADKLDVMMNILLAYIRGVCFDKVGELEWENTKKLYRECLSVFESVLLPTYATNHVQFVIFYLCSLREALSEGFVDFLWKCVQNPTAETVYRQAAASYIASFLARAAYITVSTVKIMLRLMCQWLHKYIEQADHTTQPDMWRHGPFYSVCQAVFYVFAFRHRELLDTHKGYKWVTTLGLQTLVTSRLNPLKVCPSVVGRTFASVARVHQVAFCDAIIERNNRSALPVAPTDHTPLTGVNRLDSFFPFDPYLLTRSSVYISSIYREFEGNVLDDGANAGADEEDDFVDDVGIEEADVTKNGSHDNMDFMNYGTSPGFKHI